ncbi:MAG: hypothetical protein ABL971_13205 [Vicinamibacterales bacterium]
MTQLFNQVNNQLGIILAHAELLEARAVTESDRARAAQIVASALDAVLTVRAIRDQRDHPPQRSGPETPIVWQ